MPMNEEILNQLRANDPLLLSLDLSNESIHDDDITNLCEALAPNTVLKEFDLSDGDFSLKGLTELAAVLKLKPNLTTLKLRSNNLGNAGAAIIKQITNLKTVDLSINNITDTGAQSLAQGTSFTTLILNGNEIGNRGAKAFPRESSLTSLDLSNNRVSNSGVIALARIKTLKTLKLEDDTEAPDDQLISNPGVVALSQAANLTHLDLSGQNISSDDAEAFLHNKRLTTLNLTNTRNGPAGSAVLARSPSLIVLDLADTRVGSLAYTWFLENPRLLKLNVEDCGLSDEQEARIAERIQTNRRNYVKTLFTAAVLLFNRFDSHIARLILEYVPEDDAGMLKINALAERVITRTYTHLPVCFFNTQTQAASTSQNHANAADNTRLLTNG